MWLPFALGVMAGALLAGAIANASFAYFSRELCPPPAISVSQPATEPDTRESAWQAK